MHAMFGMLLWVRMLMILQQKGFGNDGPCVRLSDFKKFYLISQNEPNNKRRLEYQAVFWAQVMLVISFFSFVIYF